MAIGCRWLLPLVVLGGLLGLCALSSPAADPVARPDGCNNHLANSTSPYLLQHARNPVDWHPWGPEALAKAKREGKPIFLSIGYSSCHWCHVMERETFTDDEIARVLNEHFVCIKVDREERPDVDHIYMTALQVYNQLNGAGKGGGWPLSMFLTPDAEPFFGGTYFPARDGDREGLPGFLTVIGKVREVWSKTPDQVREDAKTLTRFTKRELEGRRLLALSKIDSKLVDGVQTALAEQFDPRYGGFGFSEENAQLPKFPEPSNLVFLLDRVTRTDDADARRMLVVTLDRMARGGIRDHVGGGFHRYSVDRHWRIPHFEKMLYDNGQLLSVYAQAASLLKRDDFAEVTRQTADFVLREMTSPEGGFYTALDAESEGEEGKFYRWTRDEPRQVATENAIHSADYEAFAKTYGLYDPPNFEEEYFVPQLSADAEPPAAKRKILDLLLTARNKRPRPKIDTKILTADNGLMIAGLADAGRLLNEPKYIAAASRSADFVLAKLRTDDGKLLRTYAGGKADLNAYVTDYAYLVEGLIALHRATEDERWLKLADELTAKQLELFLDEAAGDFFFTSDDHETLLARAKDPVDNALPAANSVTTSNLLYLAAKLHKPENLAAAEKTLEASAGLLETSPYAAPRMAANIPRVDEVRKLLSAAKKPD